MSTSEGQLRWDDLERKHERQDWSGIDMYGGKMLGILGEGCWGWSCQERGNWEGQKGCLWMWWKRTWLRLKWRRRIQKIDTTGDGKSAVTTPDGKSRKKKKKACNHLCSNNAQHQVRDERGQKDDVCLLMKCDLIFWPTSVLTVNLKTLWNVGSSDNARPVTMPDLWRRPCTSPPVTTPMHVTWTSAFRRPHFGTKALAIRRNNGITTVQSAK